MANETPPTPSKRIILFVLIGIALLALIGLVSVLALANRPAPEPVTFRNPLNESHGSDPWMVYYEGKCYLAATTWSPSSRPGLTMKSASTIQGLIDTSPVSIYTDTDTSRCCNSWAPEFFLLDGPNGLCWYFYYSGGPWKCCDGQRMHVLESDGLDPMGPYTYKARLHDSIDGWAIDHTVLQLDGRCTCSFRPGWATTRTSISLL
jgi:GH43 family beta-xylosidase